MQGRPSMIPVVGPAPWPRSTSCSAPWPSTWTRTSAGASTGPAPRRRLGGPHAGADRV